MKTFFANVRRRWRNLVNACLGIDEFIDEHGNRYVGAEVAAYLDREDNA